MRNFTQVCSWILLVLIFTLTTTCSASNGDRTQFFHNCRQNCERQNCTADGIDFQEQAAKYYQQSVFDKAFFWTCIDECQYGCMWRTVDMFVERGLIVPQFYGKWPFVRWMGMQEPASVLFSILNLIMHVRWLKKFRREVRPDSPCFRLWHIFAVICINAWIWSAVFHTRDFELTELLDYAFAYSIVIATLYCMIMRMIFHTSIILRGLVTLIFLAFYLNYFGYLSVGKFNYSFNMTTNIVTGILSGSGWLTWCLLVRKRLPYYKKILRFHVLLGAAMCLEIIDFPPIFGTFDAHSLWHLSTAAIVPIFYSFLIDDCKMLRKMSLEDNAFRKEI